MSPKLMDKSVLVAVLVVLLSCAAVTRCAAFSIQLRHRFNDPVVQAQKLFDALDQKLFPLRSGWEALDADAASDDSVASSLATARMPMDVIETDAAFVVSAEVPGVPRDAIAVSVADGVLRIEAEVKPGRDYPTESAEPEPAQSAADSAADSAQSASSAAAVDSKPAGEAAGAKANARVLRSERFYGHVARTLKVPRSVDVSRISARHDNGVLTLTLPKSAEHAPRAVPVL